MFKILKWSITALVLICVFTGCKAADKWTLVWSDEFDETELDMSKWTYQVGNGAEYGNPGWGNNEAEYYTPLNVNVEDGKLVIEANREDLLGYRYTSGKLVTDSKFSTLYGKIEASIKMPETDGLWPAFWMLPQDNAYGGWAASGEIDIMEAKGRLPDTVGGTIHYGGAWPKNVYSTASYTFPKGQSIGSGFHTYTLEWEPDEMRWYVDGNLYSTQNKWNSQTGATENAFPAPFDKNFYLILNLAVGGNFDGGVVPPGDFSSADMEVDYVRVYQLADK